MKTPKVAALPPLPGRLGSPLLEAAPWRSLRPSCGARGCTLVRLCTEVRKFMQSLRHVFSCGTSIRTREPADAGGLRCVCALFFAVCGVREKGAIGSNVQPLLCVRLPTLMPGTRKAGSYDCAGAFSLWDRQGYPFACPSVYGEGAAGSAAAGMVLVIACHAACTAPCRAASSSAKSSLQPPTGESLLPLMGGRASASAAARWQAQQPLTRALPVNARRAVAHNAPALNVHTLPVIGFEGHMVFTLGFCCGRRPGGGRAPASGAPEGRCLQLLVRPLGLAFHV